MIKSKKISYCQIITILVLSVCICVYGIGGRTAAYSWVLALFVLGPIGVLLLLVQTIRLMVGIRYHKNVRRCAANVAISCVLAFPVLIMTGAVFIAFPAHVEEQDAIMIQSPVEGENLLFFGGRDYHTHAVWPSECYAYDIVADGHDSGSDDLEAYGIYGRNVFACVEGAVLEVHDGEADIQPNSENFTSSLGNYIYIKIKNTETYLIFAHLKQGSITVAPGEEVDKDTLIAQVGNSGTTSEPHLHLQHQRQNPCKTKIPICAEGLPILLNINE
jgi:hypothetical protein